MKIGIDIDNTITNTLPVLKEYCIRYNEEVVCRGLRMHEDGFATYNLFDWTHEEEMDFCNKHLAEAVLKAEIKESAVEVIRKLKNEGHYIYIITARKEPQFSNPYQLTKDFLDNADIEYDELIVGCEDKCSFCIEHGIKLMMDDEPQNIERISPWIPVIVFNAIHNALYYGANIHRVNTWEEAYKIACDVLKKTPMRQVQTDTNYKGSKVTVTDVHRLTDGYQKIQLTFEDGTATIVDWKDKKTPKIGTTGYETDFYKLV